MKFFPIGSCLVAAALFMLPLRSICQTTNGGINFKTRNEPDNPIFKTVSWEFVLVPSINQRAQITHLPNAKYKLNTSPQLSGEVGIQRVTHLQDNLSIAIGARFGLVGRNGTFIVPYQEIGYDLPGEYPFIGQWAADHDVTYFSFPLQTEYRIFKKENTLWYFSGGVSLRIAPLNGSSTSNMEVMEIQIRGNKKPFLNFNFGGGLAVLLKNKDLLRIGLNVNIDPSYIAEGSFSLRTNSSYDAGTYIVRGNCLGLFLSYAKTGKTRSPETLTSSF